MARTRADDYEHKRGLIFDRAAELFAEVGFDRASIAELAGRCRASKSWIYHYFPSKEAILHGILAGHMTELLQAAETALATSEPPPAQLRALLRAMIAIYAHAQAKHTLLLGQLDRLPAADQAEVRNLERQLVQLVSHLLERLDPTRARARPAKPTAMLLFGMINWTHTWYHPDGPLRPDQLADLAADVFLDGFAGAPHQRGA